MEFEFDLSDNTEVKQNIVITELEPVIKVIKPINSITDLSKEPSVKAEIENLLWHNDISTNSALIERFITEYGLKETLATNLVMIHRISYQQDKGYYTIFDREKKRSTFTKKSMKFFNTAYQSI